MSSNPAAELERAIQSRAERLAEDERRIGREEAARIERNSAEKIARLEVHEHEIAETLGAREYRRQVQAEELRLHAQIDRLRGGLVESVLAAVRERLAAVAEDDAACRKTIAVLLAEAAGELDGARLVAHLNDRDRQRLGADWQALVAETCPGREIALADESLACSGGVLVTDESGDVRLDNTFEGRLERLDGDLRRLAHEVLFRTTAGRETGFHG